MIWLDKFFPDDWYQDVTVERGAGGLDRFGNPLPVTEFEVEGILLGPKSATDDDRLGGWSDTEAAVTHGSFVFDQNDIIVVAEGERNAGRWEVQAPSIETTFGNQATVRRVNQQ